MSLVTVNSGRLMWKKAFTSVAVLSALAATADRASAQEVPAGPDVTAWISAGLGTANIPGVVAVLREAISVGPALLMVRQADIDPFIGAGSGVRERGLLVGARTGGRRLFATAALGYVRANPYHQSDNSSYPVVQPSVAAVGYDATLHANAILLGLALGLSGNIGSSNTSYAALTLSVEAGWFGRSTEHPPASY